MRTVWLMHDQGRQPVCGAAGGTICLGGKPEFAVSAGDGMLYAEMMLTGWPRSLGDQGTA
jgi:hypothetical protein